MDKHTQNRIVELLREAKHYDLAEALSARLDSKDEVLFDNEWLQLRRTPDGYVYAHEAKSDGTGVGVLAFRWRDGAPEVAGRFERCPCHHDGFALCALTGQGEPGESPDATAVRELKEEAGIDAQENEFQFLGVVRPGKQTDTRMYLYCIDVGHRDIGKAIGDGTAGEVGAYCEWTPVDNAIASKDPVLATLVVRALAHNPKVA